MLSIEQNYVALVATDNLIAKTLKLSEMSQIAKAEDRLRTYLFLRWQALSELAIKKATVLAKQGKSEKSINSAVKKIMEKWTPLVTKNFKKESILVFRLAKLAAYKKATKKTKANLSYDIEHFVPVEKADGFGMDADFSFDMADRAAIDALNDHQLYWVGSHYAENVSTAVGKNVKEVMAKAGGSSKAAGKLMPDALKKALSTVTTPAGFHGTQAQYFEALAANAMTVARAHGTMRSFMQIGIKRYQINNPIDERTCERCSHLDGKEFTVQQGAEQMYSELTADSKDAVKAAHPWLSATQIKEISPQPGFIKDPAARAADSKALAEAGQALPPFHFRCRCGVDVSVTSETYEDLVPMIPPTPKTPPKPAPHVMPQATSIAQAKSLAVEKGLADSAVYGAGITVEQANIMNTTVHDLKRKWGEIKLTKLRLTHPKKKSTGASAYYRATETGSISEIVVNTKLTKLDIWDLGYFERKVGLIKSVLKAGTAPFQKRVLYKDWLKKYTLAISNLKKGVKNHAEIHSLLLWESTLNGQMKAAITHEFGHAFHRQFRKKIDSYFKAVPKKKETWVHLAPTLRAKDDWYECVAENFAIYSSGNKKQMNKKFVKFFDDFLEGKIK